MFKTNSGRYTNRAPSWGVHDSRFLLHSYGIPERELARFNLQGTGELELRKKYSDPQRCGGRDEVPSLVQAGDHSPRPLYAKYTLSSLEPRRESVHRGFWHRIV